MTSFLGMHLRLVFFFVVVFLCWCPISAYEEPLDFGTHQEKCTEAHIKHPIGTAAGHTLAASVTDSCGHTVSAEPSVSVHPNVPLFLGNEVSFVLEGVQGRPDVASTGSDSFVMVWTELSSQGENIDGSIQAQRLAADGTPLGPKIQVNERIEGRQHRPAVAGRPDGSFVIVWQSSSDAGPDNRSAQVFLRQFNNQGQPSEEVQVQNDTAEPQLWPDVAMRPDGSFLVTWEGASKDDPDGGVMARFFNSSGDPRQRFQVNSYTPGIQSRPTLVAGPDGEFLIAWQSQGSLETDLDGYSIQLRRFNRTLEPQGPEKQVNLNTEGHQTAPSIDINASGQWVVTWYSSTMIEIGQDRTLRIGGRTGHSFNQWALAEFEVFEPIVLPPSAAHFQRFHNVVLSPNGDLVVVGADGPHTSGSYTVRTQAFFGLNNAPAPVGIPVLLDENGYGLPTIAYVGIDVEGATTDFFVFWAKGGKEHSVPFETPGGAIGIAGRKLSLNLQPSTTDRSLVAGSTTILQESNEHLLFADSFESGDTSAWSQTRSIDSPSRPFRIEDKQ